MEIEENLHPKPNSYGTSKSWSELPQDLLSSVFNRLGFAAFQRAKYVCSSWHYASRKSLPKNNNHWLILFPDDTHPCCTLFNPEEKDKLYRMKDLGVEVFAESACIASYGSWLLMKYHEYNNLYVVNLFTKENINIPTLERGSVICPVFWIEEKTKDYVVLYGRSHRLEKSDVVYCYKKGDDNVNLSCKKIPETSNCLNLVYKDHKLYFFSLLGIFKIFDFREDILKETFQCGVEIGQQVCHQLSLVAKKLVVNITGEVVFKVEKLYRPMFGTWSTWVFKIYSSGFLKKHEVVDSLGDEAILFDQGITVLATTANEGFIRNSIYFSNWEYNQDHDMFRFNLETKKAKPLHKIYFSVLQFSEWFLPSFTHT